MKFVTQISPLLNFWYIIQAMAQSFDLCIGNLNFLTIQKLGTNLYTFCDIQMFLDFGCQELGSELR